MADMINKELIFNTLAHIEQHPDEWDQETWFCDTTACFAGHALMLSGYRIVDTFVEEPIIPVGSDHWFEAFEMVNERRELIIDIQGEAARALGLPVGMASLIFGFNTRDPDKLREVIEGVVAEVERMQREDDHS